MIRVISFGDAVIVGTVNEVTVRTEEAKEKFLQEFAVTWRRGATNEYRQSNGEVVLSPIDLDESAHTETDDYEREWTVRRSMWEAVRRAGGIVDVTGTYLTDKRRPEQGLESRGMMALTPVWGSTNAELGIMAGNGYVVFDWNDGWADVKKAIEEAEG